MAGFPVAVVQHIPAPPSPLKASGSGYSSDNGEILIQLFKDATTNANVAQISRPGDAAGVQWYPRAVKYIGDGGVSDIIYNADNTSPIAINRGQHARYTGHFPNIDDRFVVEAGKLKHFVTVNAEQRAPLAFIKNPKLAVNGVLTFDPSYSVRMNGMIMTGKFDAPNGLDIVDANGHIVYSLPPVQAWDQAGNTVSGHYIVNTLAPGRLDVSMAIDQTWLAQESVVYPVVIDPTVIVASAYDINGPGARKTVRLSNNWIVSVAANSSANLYWYVSKDNNATWAQLCSATGPTVTGNFAMASNGTTVYTIVVGSSSVLSYRFDATTVTNTAQTNVGAADSSQSGFVGISLCIDGSGKLFAALCTLNATYSKTSNIRYTTSTDGGSTWSTPVQVSFFNSSSSYNIQNPTITLENGNPLILASTSGFYFSGTTIAATATSIVCFHPGTNNNSYLASGWMYTNVYVPSSLYQQSNPCPFVDGNNAVYVGWSGADATTSNLRARWSKSTDGGNTWSAMALINPGSTNTSTGVSLTGRPDNSVDAFWQEIDTAINATYTQIRRANLPAGTTTWGTPVTVTSNTTGNAQNPQTIWSEFNMNSSDAVRYMWQDNQTASIKYDSITLNSPPNAPTLTAHGNFDAATAQTLAWTFSDPDSGNTQSAFQLQIVEVDNGSTVVDTGKVASTSSAYNLATNTLANGKQYQWRVQTWDQSGAQGPYSSYSTFNTAAAPTVTITSPSNGGTVPSSSVTVQFSYSDPGNNAQQSFDIQLLDSTDGTVLKDSGVIHGTGNQYTVQYTLTNTTTYHVKVTATNSQGITSAAADASFSVSFTPPATPTVTVSPQTSYMAISITNPAPSGSQPTVSYNDLLRRKTGGSEADWARIATNLANNATYSDYGVASGQSYDYKVTANGNDLTTSDSTVSTNNSVVLPGGMWLHDVSDPAGTILTLPYFEAGGSGGQTPNTEQWTPTATEMQFAGRKYPVVEFGEAESFQVTRGNVAIVQDDATWNSLSSLLRNQTTLCLRDTRGRVVFGNVTVGYQETDLLFGRQLPIQITQTDYSEVV